MIDPVSTSVGGVLGAIIGAFWGDPFRDSEGKYRPYWDSFFQWVAQVVIGAGIGNAVTAPVTEFVLEYPSIGVIAIIIGSYAVYVEEIDPR